MKPLPIACLAVVFFYGILGSALRAGEVDPEVWQRLRPFLATRKNPEELQQMKEALYQVPNWENRLAEALARLAVASRYNGPYDKLKSIEFALPELHQKAQRGEQFTAEELERYKQYVLWTRGESRVLNKANEAGSGIYTIMEALGNMADERAIPLIAPILSERGRIINSDSDVAGSTPQADAAHGLRLLVLRGVSLPDAPITKYSDVEHWRIWWKENRAKYGPVPPALAALEVTEGGTRPIPAAATPPPAPPATPVITTPVLPPAVFPSTPETKTEIAPSAPKLSFVWLLAIPAILGLFALLARRHKT